MINFPKYLPYILNGIIMAISISYGYNVYKSLQIEESSQNYENIENESKGIFMLNILVAIFISFIFNSDILKLGML